MPSFTSSTSASPVIIRDGPELLTFSRTRAFFDNRPIVFDVPGARASSVPAAEQLNAYRTDCGCAAGARAMVAAFALVLALLTVRYGTSPWDMLARLPVAFLAAFVGAGAGKLTGIALARRRAHREVARILALSPGRS
jgi:hypothetical protein